MEGLTLMLSLVILAGLYWLHRRALDRAYAAGQTDAYAEQGRRERHGLVELPAPAEPGNTRRQ